LQLFISKQQNDWAKLLSTAEFVLNSRVQSAHWQTPFEVLYGYQPDFTLPAGKPTKIPTLDQCLQLLCEARKEAEAALQMNKEQQKDLFEADKNQAHEFQVGNKVWLSAKNVHIHHASQKLGPRQLSPYTITKKIGPLVYSLDLPPVLKIHKHFHVD
jgi:hypothetical protein